MKEFKILKLEYGPDLPWSGFSHVIKRQHAEIEGEINKYFAKGWEILDKDVRDDYIIFFMIRDTKLRNMENEPADQS